MAKETKPAKPAKPAKPDSDKPRYVYSEDGQVFGDRGYARA